MEEKRAHFASSTSVRESCFQAQQSAAEGVLVAPRLRQAARSADAPGECRVTKREKKECCPMKTNASDWGIADDTSGERSTLSTSSSAARRKYACDRSQPATGKSCGSEAARRVADCSCNASTILGVPAAITQPRSETSCASSESDHCSHIHRCGVGASIGSCRIVQKL